VSPGFCTSEPPAFVQTQCEAQAQATASCSQAVDLLAGLNTTSFGNCSAISINGTCCTGEKGCNGAACLNVVSSCAPLLRGHMTSQPSAVTSSTLSLGFAAVCDQKPRRGPCNSSLMMLPQGGGWTPRGSAAASSRTFVVVAAAGTPSWMCLACAVRGSWTPKGCAARAQWMSAASVEVRTSADAGV
jgi:hypothetical protein